MPWNISSRFVRNTAQLFSSPPIGKRLNIIEKIEGLSFVDKIFAPRDSPKPLQKKMAMLPSFPLVMAFSMIPNAHPLTRYCERHSWGRVCFFSNLNQPVRGTQNIIRLDHVGCAHLRPDVGQLFSRLGNRSELELRPEHRRRHEDTDRRDAKPTQGGQNYWRLGVLKVTKANFFHPIADCSEKAAKKKNGNAGIGVGNGLI